MGVPIAAIARSGRSGCDAAVSSDSVPPRLQVTMSTSASPCRADTRVIASGTMPSIQSSKPIRRSA